MRYYLFAPQNEKSLHFKIVEVLQKVDSKILERFFIFHSFYENKHAVCKYHYCKMLIRKKYFILKVPIKNTN